jgi:hypothetical protein
VPVNLTLAEILARTAAAKAAGRVRTYPEHRGKGGKGVGEKGQETGKAPAPKPAPQKRTLPCVSLGEPTGGSIRCKTCAGNMQKIFTCATHGTCSIGKPVSDTGGKPIACCATCAQYEAKPAQG